LYQISRKRIEKETRSPLFVLLFSLIFAFVMGLLSYYAGLGWSGPVLTCGVAGVVCCFARYVGSRHYLKWAKKHGIKLHIDGLQILEAELESILPWDKISSVKVKKKRGKEVGVVLRTKESSVLELSDYENFDRLKGELEKYVDTNAWL
jgi:hypothetical protein